ncbi:MAG: hypothetical protein NZU63_06320, partial [Gemmataceae bacterium]|nr:hypothetical protein [Gemmataceae bacterium]
MFAAKWVWRRWWQRLWKRQQRPVRRYNPAALGLEALEDRTAPAIYVTQVADINPGASGSMPTYSANYHYMVDYNGALYFAANDGVLGNELWRSDGTPGGTVSVTNMNPSGDANPTWLTVYNGKLYFAADDGSTGVELWSYDATTNTLTQVADINPGAASSNPQWLTVYNGILYFAADDGSTGVELWSYDATTNTLT